MKWLTYILTIIAVFLIIYNATKIDYNAPFKEDSLVAVITICAAVCAIVLLAIIRVSNKIDAIYKIK